MLWLNLSVLQVGLCPFSHQYLALYCTFFPPSLPTALDTFVPVLQSALSYPWSAHDFLSRTCCASCFYYSFGISHSYFFSSTESTSFLLRQLWRTICPSAFALAGFNFFFNSYFEGRDIVYELWFPSLPRPSALPLRPSPPQNLAQLKCVKYVPDISWVNEWLIPSRYWLISDWILSAL